MARTSPTAWWRVIACMNSAPAVLSASEETTHTQTSEMHRVHSLECGGSQLLPSFECVHFDTLQTRQEHFIFDFVRLHQRNREKDSKFSLFFFSSFVRSSFELHEIKKKQQQIKLCLRMKICVLCWLGRAIGLCDADDETELNLFDGPTCSRPKPFKLLNDKFFTCRNRNDRNIVAQNIFIYWKW